ncbi:MAG: radical SAM protein, partial [Deltaproteobacteria bacterium]
MHPPLDDRPLAAQKDNIAPLAEGAAGEERRVGKSFTSGTVFALNTTARCQHDCVFCIEGHRKGYGEVPSEEARRTIAAMAPRVDQVVFMGAEPTLNPDLPELVRFAKQQGVRAMLSTNALRLAQKGYLEKLLSAGLDGIEMSFHYPDAEIYGKITRRAARGFSRLLLALDAIERSNAPRAASDRLGV